MMIALLCAMVGAAAVAQGGRDRCDMWNRISWVLWAALVALAWSLPNRWAAACVGVLALGFLTWRPLLPKTDRWQRSGLPALAATACYAAVSPAMTPDAVPWLLWTFIAVGCWAGLWTDYSRQHGFAAYVRWWPGAPAAGRPWGVCWHEDSPTHLKAGQGNANHLQSVAALSTAAMYGVVWLGQWWALLAWPLVTQPLLRQVTKGTRLGQGHLHLLTLGVTALGLWSQHGRVLGLLWLAYGSTLVVVARPWRPRPHWIDGHRLALWRVIWQAFRRQPWHVQGLGLGTGTWLAFTGPITMPAINGTLFTTAHNEWFQMLIEQGWLGLLMLLGYSVDLLHRLWMGGPEGQALFLVAATLGSIATTNFPWSWFHEIPQPPSCATCHKPVVSLGGPRHPAECQCLPPQVVPPQPYYVGSPALIAMSLAVACVAEAF